MCGELSVDFYAKETFPLLLVLGRVEELEGGDIRDLKIPFVIMGKNNI